MFKPFLGDNGSTETKWQGPVSEVAPTTRDMSIVTVTETVTPHHLSCHLSIPLDPSQDEDSDYSYGKI